MSQSPPSTRSTVSPARRIHILDGDATGGGHRAGTGSGGTEFPASWSDDEIISAVESIANDNTITRQPSGQRVTLTGVRNGISIRVVVDPSDGSIVTGYPTRP